MSLLQSIAYSDAACTVPALYIAQMAPADVCTATVAASGGGACVPSGQASVKVSCESVSDIPTYVNGLSTHPIAIGLGYSETSCNTPIGFYASPGTDLNKSLDANGKFPFTFPSGETIPFVPNSCTGLTASQGQIISGLPAIAAVKVYGLNGADVVTSTSASGTGSSTVISASSVTTTTGSSTPSSSSVAHGTTTSVGPNASTRSKAISIVALLPLVLVGMCVFF